MRKGILPAAAGLLFWIAIPARGAPAAQGAAGIYKRQCASCHGQDGTGNTGAGKAFKVRDLKSAEVQNLTNTQLLDTIAKGKGKMPSYINNLGKTNIEAVVAYLRQMAKGGGAEKKKK